MLEVYKETHLPALLIPKGRSMIIPKSQTLESALFTFQLMNFTCDMDELNQNL